MDNEKILNGKLLKFVRFTIWMICLLVVIAIIAIIADAINNMIVYITK